MQAFTHAVKGAFGHGPVFTDTPTTARAVAGADSHPPPRHAPVTEPQAGGVQAVDAVLRTQSGLGAVRFGRDGLSLDMAYTASTTDGSVGQQP